MTRTLFVLLGSMLILLPAFGEESGTSDLSTLDLIREEAEAYSGKGKHPSTKIIREITMLRDAESSFYDFANRNAEAAGRAHHTISENQKSFHARMEFFSEVEERAFVFDVLKERSRNALIQHAITEAKRTLDHPTVFELRSRIVRLRNLGDLIHLLDASDRSDLKAGHVLAGAAASLLMSFSILVPALEFGGFGAAVGLCAGAGIGKMAYAKWLNHCSLSRQDTLNAIAQDVLGREPLRGEDLLHTFSNELRKLSHQLELKTCGQALG